VGSIKPSGQSSLKSLSHCAIATCRHFLCRGDRVEPILWEWTLDGQILQNGYLKPDRQPHGIAALMAAFAVIRPIFQTLPVRRISAVPGLEGGWPSFRTLSAETLSVSEKRCPVAHPDSRPFAALSFPLSP